jgi:hypothetical protein
VASKHSSICEYGHSGCHVSALTGPLVSQSSYSVRTRRSQ